MFLCFLLRLLQFYYQTILRTAFLLCESYVCADVMAAKIAELPLRQQRTVNTYGVLNDRIYCLIGIILESLLVLVCVYLIVLILFVWKVARASMIYVVILALLVISEGFMLGFWASLMRNFEVITRLDVVFMLPSKHDLYFYLFIYSFACLSGCFQEFDSSSCL